MPVYNGESYIKEALDSLLAQTVKDFELIISDNASTDSTQSICEAYAAKDSRISYVRQSENLGAANNFIYVLKAAKCEYFMWAASDDTWLDNWLDVLLRNFQLTDMALFSGYCAGDSELFYLHDYPQGSYTRFLLDSTRRPASYFYIYAIFRREILLRSDLHFLNCPHGPDVVLLLNMLKLGGFRCVHGSALNYRIHSDNTSKKMYGARNRLMIKLKIFPFSYYRMILKAAPVKWRFIMPFVLAWQYIRDDILQRSLRLFRRCKKYVYEFF